MTNDFILVSDDENGEPTEVPVEMDGSIYLPSIANQYPGATTLKYRNPQTNTFRLVKCMNGVLHPPAEGWAGVVYIVVKPPGEEDRKRKRNEGSWSSNNKRPMMGMNNSGWGGAGYGDGSSTAQNFIPTGFIGSGSPPNEAVVSQLLKRSGYNLERGPGERKYGSPPPRWEGSAPGDGCEVYVGNLPMDMYEDSLVPMFEQFGRIYEMRLKMDPSTGLGRGFCFVVYSCKEEAIQCVRQLKWYEIAPEQFLKVNIQINNSRLFVGNIPKEKGKGELQEVFGPMLKHLTDIIIYTTPGSKQANRGFCFLDFENHKAASDAKRKLMTLPVWSRELMVSWADTQEEPSEKAMEHVKTLYVRNLSQAATEEVLRETFEQFGSLEKVKKVRDFAFVHFLERAHCLAAMEAMNGESVEGAELEITLARPADKGERNKLQQKKEERKMQFQGRGGMGNMSGGGSYGYHNTPFGGMSMGGGYRGGQRRGGFGNPGRGFRGGRGRGFRGGRGGF